MIARRLRLRPSAIRCLLLAAWGVVALPSAGLAQRRPPDLSQVSIEDLMSIEITSASRKEQRTADVAAAVFVITHDDIRRSGMTSIPDLLRLAPGVEVAQINSNKWAVSVRGFNGLFADKLLVLIDGRSLYNRIFAGVLWDTEDLMVDDIDRIEVIRGPGATIWGANAVNGVINIVTRATADTLGVLVRADGGSSGEQGAARYGGAIGQGTYRVYSQWTGRDQSVIVPGTGANDSSHSMTTGFRSDWTSRASAFMLEGSYTSVSMHSLWPNLDPQTVAAEPIVTDASHAESGQVLARWTLTRDGGSTLQTQSFVDVARREEPIGLYNRTAVGVDTQYHSALGAHQDLVAGVGFRFIDESLFGRVGFSLTPAEDTSALVTAFVQDEIGLLGNRLAITLGSQVQHDSDIGAGIQPTARVMWKGLPHQRLWAATSRALRTPSLVERGSRVDFPSVETAAGGLPVLVTTLGNSDAATETFTDVEAGYRLEIGAAASIDVTGFTGWYQHLQAQVTTAPTVQLVPTPALLVVSRVGNQLEATTRGLEVAAHWMPSSAWRFDGSYTGFRLTARSLPVGQDAVASPIDENAPDMQWQLRSGFSPVPRATFNIALFHVGELEQLKVAAYTRADVSAEWRFSSRISAMATGQNLLDAAHAEFAGAQGLILTTQVQRSASLRLRWTFR